ncbi:hypothetical protein L7G72_12700 [Xenorhabdus bovienii]|uniref:hypothetical protein n=1 Tax=Xenorhabdus bovienii TaxID=40576 RepID=UPI001EE06B27|nr:hypothetical protein [Xenorhabdus bovienii]MCG3462699.1 hypothetical protein [Xenorhabdus bovienii]
MKETPIIFNADMVRAILDGRKTQTRRAVKYQPCELPDSPTYPLLKDGKLAWCRKGEDDHGGWIDCPYGKIGDQLWVRETFCPVFDAQYAEGEIDWIDYRATPRYSAEYPAGWHLEPEDPAALKWRPSIHMPRWASRITLEVTDTRVERLQDIKEEDALAEGIKTGRFGNKSNWRDGFYAPGDNQPCFSAKEAFKYLWQSIYSEESWNNNPWVWVIEFRRINNDK